MIGREKGKISIRKILEKRDVNLYYRIETLWTEAQELQERQRSKEHHQQGSLHCMAVENNIGKIISDDEKNSRFSPQELFLISAAACYHDAGKSDDFDEGHAEVAMKDIYSYPEKYHLSDPEGKVLSYIIGSHDIDEVFDDTPETYPIGNDDIHVRLLSALFKLADVLHTDNSRIPHIIVGDTKKEEDKTRFRQLIKGWDFDAESQIKMTAAPESPKDISIIEKGVSMTQKQIERIAPVLQAHGYPHRIKSSIDQRKIKWDAEKENERTLIEMDFYTEDEARIFKGRDRESGELLTKVIGSNTTLLIGNSGVGKTSLIRAGLFPRFRSMGWNCIWTRPINPDPATSILNDINAKLSVGYESSDITSSIKKLTEQCDSDIIIVIDQFEDILRSPPPEKEKIGQTLLRIYGKSFRNVHIMLSYRGDYEAEIGSFLDKSGITHPNRFHLLGLDKSVAIEVLRTIFSTSNVGITDDLLKKIIEEIDKKSENGRFYPPFIQIVASSLINLAKSNNGIITEELYNNKAVTVENIIGNYLIYQLNEFGDANSEKRKNVEEILKELIRDRAKEHKNKSDLKRYLQITDNELQELLDLLVKKRLIRHLDNENYEIIHDFLASKVEEMIKDSERPLRGVRDILRTKAKHYKFIPTFLEPNEMALLYSMKESIIPDIDEKELLIFSYLVGNGPAWWWFREDKGVYISIVKKALAGRSSKVIQAATVALERLGTDIVIDPKQKMERVAAGAFEKFATHSNLITIIDMLKDSDIKVKRTRIEAFERLVIHSDLHTIIDMLKDANPTVKRMATRAFERLVIHSDISTIIDMLKDTDPTVKRMATRAFERLVIHSDIPTIIDFLNEKNPYLRKVVTEALLKLVTRDKINSILYLRMDYDKKAKDATVDAVIEKLTAYNDFETIMGMINSRDVIVRRTAFTMLEAIVTHNDLTPIIYMIFKGKDIGYFYDRYLYKEYLEDIEVAEKNTPVSELDSMNISRLKEFEIFFKGGFHRFPINIDRKNKLDEKTLNNIKKAWTGIMCFYKEDEMHWEDTEKEVGFLKNIDALNAFLEPFLLSPTSFIDPPIEIEMVIKHLEMILKQLEGVESNKDGGDYRGFTSTPYSYIQIDADFTDSTSSFLILASNVVDFLRIFGRRKEKIPLDLETRLKGVVLKAVDSLLESRIEDWAGVRWQSIKVKTDPPGLYANVFFTNYATLSLYRIINNKTIEGWLDERKSEIEKVLSNVPKWVESLYDPDTKRYWADTKKSQVHVATTAYALEINYTLYKELSDEQISQSRDAMNTIAETIIREHNKLQADIYYIIPLLKKAGNGFYDDRFYVGRLLSLLSLAKEKDTENFTSIFQAAGEKLFRLVQEEWIDEPTNMWDDGRPLICYTKDAMLGICNSSLKTSFGIKTENEMGKAFEKLVTHDDLSKIIDILKSGYYMRNRGRHVSYAAFFAFEKLVTHDDLPKIIGLLRERSWYARRAAIKAFEKLVTHDDLNSIINILRDSEHEIRDVAVKAFEKLVTHDDLTTVIDMLRSPEPNIKEAAERVFEKLATYDDFSVIADMLKDSSPNVRNEAYKTMIKFGNENDLIEVVKKFASGEITNIESLKYIVALDEKFYSPFENNIS